MKKLALIALLLCAACTIEKPDEDLTATRASKFIYDPKAKPVESAAFIYDANAPQLRASKFLISAN